MPGNVEAVNAFMAMATQWRSGIDPRNGKIVRTGFDYVALPAVLRFIEIPRANWGAVFDDLRVMEAAALEFMYQT